MDGGWLGFDGDRCCAAELGRGHAAADGYSGSCGSEEEKKTTGKKNRGGGGGCWAATQIWTGQRRKSNGAVLLCERKWRRQIGRSASVGETRR